MDPSASPRGRRQGSAADAEPQEGPPVHRPAQEVDARRVQAQPSLPDQGLKSTQRSAGSSPHRFRGGRIEPGSVNLPSRVTWPVGPNLALRSLCARSRPLWQRVVAGLPGVPERPPPGRPRDWSVDIVSGSTWKLADGRTILTTTNGGQNWRAATSNLAFSSGPARLRDRPSRLVHAV